MVLSLEKDRETLLSIPLAAMSSTMEANMEAQEVNPDSAVDRREGSIANADDAKALASGEGQLCSSPESSKKKKKDSSKKAKKTAEKHASKSHKGKNNKAKKVTIATPGSSSDDSSDEEDNLSSSDESTESEVELPDVKKKLGQKKRQNIHPKANKKTKAKKLKKVSKAEKKESSDDSTSDSDSGSDDNSQLAEDQNAAIAPVQQQVQDLQQQVQQMQRQVLSMNLGNNGMLPMTGLNGASFNANALGAGGLGGGLGAGNFGSGGLNAGFNGGFHDDLDIMMGRPPPGRGGARNRRIVLPPPGGDRHRRGSNPLGGEGLFDNGGEPSSLGSKASRGGKAGAQRMEFKRVDQVWDSQIHNYKLQDTAEGTINSSYDGFLFHVRRTFDWEGKYKATIVDIKSKALREALQDVMGNIKGVSLVEETPKLDPNMLFL